MDMVLGMGALGLSFFLGGWFALLATVAIMTVIPLVMWLADLRHHERGIGLSEWLGAIWAAVFVVPWLVVLLGAATLAMLGRELTASAVAVIWGLCSALTLLGFHHWARRRYPAPQSPGERRPSS